MKPLLFVRGLIKSVKARAGRLGRFDASGRIGEEFTNREMMQQYGFSSRPKAGAECLMIKAGQSVYMIASDDRRYRIDLEEGEVVVYNTESSKVHLKKGGEIEIQCAVKVHVKADKTVIESGNISLGAEALSALGGGVVTVMCSCAMSGAPHPVGSSSVKGAL